VIAFARRAGVFALIVAAGIFFIDIQLSRYGNELVLRSFRDIFLFFDIRMTEPWDFGLLPESLIWTLLWNPLLSLSASVFFSLVGLVLLAVGRKAPKLNRGDLFGSGTE